MLCFLVVLVKHRFSRSGRQCCSRKRIKLSAPVLVKIAQEQMIIDTQVAMFLAYTSVFNSVQLNLFLILFLLLSLILFLFL